MAHNAAYNRFGGMVRNPSRPAEPRFEQPRMAAWADAVDACMGLEGHLIAVNSRSSSEQHRQELDDQLALIFAEIARIARRTIGGREPARVVDETGYPPGTFTPVFSMWPGGQFAVVQQWVQRGMDTLLDFLTVDPPRGTSRNRTMVMYGTADDRETLGGIEQQVRKVFEPCPFEKSWGEGRGDGIARVFFQVELFPDELARALGCEQDGPEVRTILQSLEAQGQMLRANPLSIPSPSEAARFAERFLEQKHQSNMSR